MKDNRLKDLEPADDEYLFFIEKLKNKEPFSFAHFNDGECNYMFDMYKTPISRGYQDYSNELKERLIKSFLINNKNFYRGLPCPFHDETTYDKCIQMLNTNNINFSIAHACVFHHNYSTKKQLFFDILKTYDSITWIANDKFNLDILSSKIGLDKNKSKVIKVPEKNAFDCISMLENNSFEDGEIVILLCGPIGRILAGEYFQKYPKTTFLCLGSYFDNILFEHIKHGYHYDRFMYCEICCTY